jgi:glucose-1-phosphate thymidylyltransferase
VQAVILAAGIGARLSPLTSVIPKALLPIANIPLIDYVLDSIQRVGIREIIVVTGYKGPTIVKYLETPREDNITEIRCVKANEYKAGPLYSLLAAERFVKDDFLLVPADLILDQRILTKLVASHAEKDMVRVAITKRHLQTQRAFVLRNKRTRRDNTTTIRFCLPESVGAKSQSGNRIRPSVSIGAIICPTRLFEYAHTATGNGSERVIDALNEYIRDTGLGRCITISGQQYWFDIDTIEDMLEANSYILRKRLTSDRSPGQFYLDRETLVTFGRRLNSHQSRPARVLGPVLIGERCIIGEGAIIGPCVSIQDKCIIGRHARISNTIIIGNSRIRDSAIISGAIFCGQETVRSGKPSRDVKNE